MLRHRAEFHEVVFFCTMAGRGGSAVLGEMARLVGKDPVATLQLTEAELGSGGQAGKFAGFAKELGEASG